MPASPQAARYHAALKAVFKRAIIVLDALGGDSEMRFQNQVRRGAWRLIWGTTQVRLRLRRVSG
ncbi:hypothetical protein AB7813_08945 [Tardiphaga sp. 20_F10_N6_6]|uniref:hypothetical protein n=1 Tax=Tardiphaga sp. 20_F10_N6_6 TaxID=3240788 RepID=UPI003F88E8F3